MDIYEKTKEKIKVFNCFVVYFVYTAQTIIVPAKYCPFLCKGIGPWTVVFSC